MSLARLVLSYYVTIWLVLVEQLVNLASKPWGAVLTPDATIYAFFIDNLELEGSPAAIGISTW